MFVEFYREKFAMEWCEPTL